MMLAFVIFTLITAQHHAGGSRIILGNEVLRDSSYSGLEHARIGILTNPTGVFSDSLEHIVDNMSSQSYLDVACIFGPEHGFRGEKQAETGDSKFYIDIATGIPVFSAYNATVAELSNVLIDMKIDVLLVDMQDTGVRLYTFIWTMYNMISASTISSTRVMIADRPNPLGGNTVEGPLLNSTCCSSGYGLFPITHIHGMTIGELALLFNSLFNVQMTVIQTKNWRRNMIWAEEGLGLENTLISRSGVASNVSYPPWIPPSPNIPTTRTALAYGATCFLEATTASEGRGTNTPFQLFGAPFIDAASFSARLNIDFNCPSSANGFRPTYFSPMWSKYNGTTVPGTQWLVERTLRQQRTVTAADLPVPLYTLSPFADGVRILCVLRDLSIPSDAFQWDGSWFGHPGSQLIDEYAGTTTLRLMIDAGVDADTIITSYQSGSNAFRDTRRPFLLYV